MPRLCVIGSANVDFTVALPRLPRVGETVSSGTLLVNRGGKGANQAVAARRLGAEVRMIGCVGDDGNGRFLLRSMEEEGVDISRVKVHPSNRTGHSEIATREDGRHALEQQEIGVADEA